MDQNDKINPSNLESINLASPPPLSRQENTAPWGDIQARPGGFRRSAADFKNNGPSPVDVATPAARRYHSRPSLPQSPRKDGIMRRICLGLLVLLAAAPGCLWSDPEVGGWMQNYNGVPWTSLMRTKRRPKQLRHLDPASGIYPAAAVCRQPGSSTAVARLAGGSRRGHCESPPPEK